MLALWRRMPENCRKQMIVRLEYVLVLRCAAILRHYPAFDRDEIKQVVTGRQFAPCHRAWADRLRYPSVEYLAAGQRQKTVAQVRKTGCIGLVANPQRRHRFRQDPEALQA